MLSFARGSHFGSGFVHMRAVRDACHALSCWVPSARTKASNWFIVVRGSAACPTIFFHERGHKGIVESRYNSFGGEFGVDLGGVEHVLPGFVGSRSTPMLPGRIFGVCRRAWDGDRGSASRFATAADWNLRLHRSGWPANRRRSVLGWLVIRNFRTSP